MITYFKDNSKKPKRKYEKYKTLTSVLESIDRVVLLGASTKSVTLSVTDVGLIVVPISAEIACTLSTGKKVLQKVNLNEYNEYKKQKEKDQQTMESSDKLFSKRYQDILIDKEELVSLCKFFTTYVDETKKDFFK